MDLSPADVHTPSAVGTAPPRAEKKTPAALAIVIDGSGRVLTVSRPEPPHEMSIPGGHVDDGELPGDAAMRELREETGIVATKLSVLGMLTSPTDGRAVHVFRVTSWTGQAHAAEGGTRVEWLSPSDLLAQSSLYRATVEKLMTDGALSAPGAEGARAMTISAEKRDALPEQSFALPEQRKYPLDTAARVRNAATRLEQMKKRGKVSDADYKKARARIAAAAKKFGIESQYNESDQAAPKRRQRPRSVHVRADLAPGGVLHVRHMTASQDGAQVVLLLDDGSYGLRDVRPIKQGDAVDPSSVGIALMGKPTWKDGTPKKLVWIQIAECGAWNGHPAGPFEMTSTTFSEIVRNFTSRGLPVPFDFEHASEQDPTSGSVPQTGAPAPGWVHRLDNRGPAGLWGLVEWFDYAREKIDGGEIAFLSPAIRFGCKDPRTGAKIGARLTSVALTNQPFLTGLDGLRAASDKSQASKLFAADRFSETAVVLGGKGLLDRKVHAANEVMPRVKQALKLHPLASHDEVSEHLDKLRDACMSAGADGMYQGENLNDYMQPLTELVGPSLGACWEDVIDALHEFVDGEIEKHVFEGVPLYDNLTGSAPVVPDDPNQMETAMADNSATIALKDAQEKITGLTGEKDKLDGENAKLSLQLKDVQGRAEAAEKIVEGIKGAVTLKDGETVEQAITRLVEENKTLLADKQARNEADLQADVDVAFATYKDAKKLDDKQKGAMLRLAKADRQAFNEMYPPVPVEQRHLMREVTPPAPRPRPSEVESAGMSFTALTKKLMADAKKAGRKLSFTDAQIEASRLLAEASRPTTGAVG